MANEKKTDSTKEEKKDAKDEKKPKETKEAEMTEEDKELKEELELLVNILDKEEVRLHMDAFKKLREHIRSSTTSMTSVPKPLKFLGPHFDTMKAVYEKETDATLKQFCADVVSVLAMTNSTDRECLKFRFLGSNESIGSWGHEYVRHLTGEVCKEHQDATPAHRERLLALLKEILPYLMAHNAEAEACDALMEVDSLGLLEGYTSREAAPRVCLYLKGCVSYVPEPEDSNILKTVVSIYRKFDKYPDAMLAALRLKDLELVSEIFNACEDTTIQRQLAYMLARQQVFIETEDEELTEIQSNTQLSTSFQDLARELDIMEAKVPEDVYKSHLEPSRVSGAASLDSARMNLASSFVNGFLNCGFGEDKLLKEDGNKWIYKNKEHGMLSATASLGLILLWDVDGGLTQIDKYLYSNDDQIKAGALMACGIVNSGVRNECDPALALLSDYVTNNKETMRIGAIIGLGLAYAGSNREDVISLLLPVFAESKVSMEVVGMTALSCGMIAVGSCNSEVTSTILQALLEKTEADLKDTFARFLALGLGLLYLGRQDAADVVAATLETVPDPFGAMATTLLDICAYAGTGNVLKIQKLLHICSEHYEPKDQENNDKKTDKNKKDDKKDEDKEKEAEKKATDLTSQQGVAVLGIALIAMGEEIGAEMALRSFGHLLRYGEPVIRKSVPLALALLSTSNPQLRVLDTLSKFSHDSNPEVTYNSILAMGITGAGTNNARLAAMLRQLAVYYSKDTLSLFMVRLAQGLTHLGKGTLSLNPFHSDRQLLSPVAVSGLLAVLVACLDVKSIILGKFPYMLYFLTSAIQPRMLVTVDEDLKPLTVTVRVGQAVDVVGQAGKPKTITGFQTHTTPVLLAYGERAELATEEYIALTPVLEGFVILRKNPDF